MALLVGGHPAAQLGGEPLAALPLASVGEPLRQVRDIGTGGQRLGPDTVGDPHRARRRERVPQPLLGPAAEIRREDGEVVRAAGVTAPGATAVVTVSCTCSRTPSASSARRSRRSRRWAWALTSDAMCTSSASASATTLPTSSTRSPSRRTSRPPRSRRPASRSCRQPARKASRLGTANPSSSTARSRTNSGTVRSAPSRPPSAVGGRAGADRT